METYNAALNKPAYQSSNHLRRSQGSPDVPYSANYANDGSRQTTYSSSPYCAVTKNETNPWWAVDLQQPTTIYGVKLTASRHSRKTKLLAYICLIYKQSVNGFMYHPLNKLKFTEAPVTSRHAQKAIDLRQYFSTLSSNVAVLQFIRKVVPHRRYR